MIISYAKLIEDTRQLFKKINWQKYTAIFPIPNGGIAVGIVIATLWEGIKVLSLAEYESHPNPSQVLIVDDIVDSWKTFELYNRGSDIAVVYKKFDTPKIPTYWYEETTEWSIFPHESKSKGIAGHVANVLEFAGINPAQTNAVERVIAVLKQEFN